MFPLKEIGVLLDSLFNTSSPIEATFYDIKQTMKVLGVGRTTIYKWIKKGKLVAYKKGNRIYFYQKTIDDIRQQKQNIE